MCPRDQWYVFCGDLPVDHKIILGHLAFMDLYIDFRDVEDRAGMDCSTRTRPEVLEV